MSSTIKKSQQLHQLSEASCRGLSDDANNFQNWNGADLE